MSSLDKFRPSGKPSTVFSAFFTFYPLKALRWHTPCTLHGRVQRRTFSLIELIAAMGLIALLSGIVLGIFDSGTRAWRATSSRVTAHDLARQTLDTMMEGNDFYPGLREAAELKSISPSKVVFVPYQTDYFRFRGGLKVGQRFELRYPYKQGTSPPLAEVAEPNGSISIIRAGVERNQLGKTALIIDEPFKGDGTLMVTYFPDASLNKVLEMTFDWDSEVNILTRTFRGEQEQLKLTLADAQITDFEFTYLDAISEPLPVHTQRTGAGVTAIEVQLTTKSGDETMVLQSLVNLRNLRSLGGVVPMGQGSRFYLPPSNEITDLSLLNVTGAKPGHQAVITISQGQKTYVATLFFGSRTQPDEAGNMVQLQSVSIQYPKGNPIFSKVLNRPLTQGISLLDLGNEDADYDLDSANDAVKFLGKDIKLTVERLDPTGIGMVVQ